MPSFWLFVIRPDIYENIKQHERLKQRLTERSKIAKEKINIDLENKINIESYRNLAQDAGLPRNKYSYLILPSVLDDIDLLDLDTLLELGEALAADDAFYEKMERATEKKYLDKIKFVQAILPALRDRAFVIISTSSDSFLNNPIKEEIEFFKIVTQAFGYTVSDDIKNLGPIQQENIGSDAFMLSLTRDNNRNTNILPDKLLDTIMQRFYHNCI